MKDKSIKAVFTKRRILSACALLLICAFVAVSPSIIEPGLDRDEYREWMELKTEPKVMVINVWHIVGFRPYAGSLGTWLEKRAEEYRKDLIGIHFEINSFSPEEAANRLARGMTPDIISFMSGTQSERDLLALDGSASALSDNTASGSVDGILYAVPYCASGMLLLYDPFECEGLSAREIAAKAESPEKFRSGKAPACICDIRGAADMHRAELMGSAPYFEAMPYNTDEPCRLVQYLGIRRQTDEAKLKYAEGFIEYLTKPDAQTELGSIGLLPISAAAAPEYEQDWLRELYGRFDPEKLPYCFN